MTNQELKTEIESYIGKTFKYEGSNFKLIEVKQNMSKYILKTDRRTFVLTLSELRNFLYDLELVEHQPAFVNKSVSLPKAKDPESSPEKTIDLQIYTPTDTQKKIQDSLIAMLEKVQTDPKAIPQAKAICDIANTMVNMEKNQINLMNAVKRKR